MFYSINGIWFSKNGRIPKDVFLESKSRIGKFKKSNCLGEVVLWTDEENINFYDIHKIKDLGIIIKDYRILGKRWISFIEKSLKMAYVDDDFCGFAMASDIVRIAAIELLKDDEFYIYSDINDVNINTQNVEQIKNNFFNKNCKLVLPMIEGIVSNNSVITTYKNTYISDFIEKYFVNLSNNFEHYKKPKNKSEAINAVFPISNLTGFMLFEDLSSVYSFEDIFENNIREEGKTSWMQKLPESKNEDSFLKNQKDWLSDVKKQRIEYFYNLKTYK